MEKKSIVGYVESITPGKTKKGADMWTIRIDADSFKLFEKHRPTVKYLETMQADKKPVEVILIKKDDSAYFNFEDESEARPAPDGFLEVAQAPGGGNTIAKWSGADTNRSIESQVAAKIVSDCLQAKVSVPEEIKAPFWQWIGQRLAPAPTPQPHQDAPQPAQGPSEEKADTQALRGKVVNAINAKGMTIQAAKAWLLDNYERNSTKDMTVYQLRHALDLLAEPPLEDGPSF